MKKIELLAPAGSMEAMKAAVQAGADAVYLAGPRFGARYSAENFTEETLAEAIAYCHIRGVRVYAAVNTLIKPEEMQAALESVGQLRTMGTDAVIVQDLGLASLIRQTWPDLELHGSTQMSLYDEQGVKAALATGISRVVIARETSAAEVKEIVAATGAEIEAFVHGALCYSYSGQCLMSSQIGGRSGNRGRCAQPCRKRYRITSGSDGNGPQIREGYVLSTKDLMTLERVKELADSGITSLKIEGRLRRSDYVAAVVASYRQALDRLSGTDTPYPEGAPDIGQVFNRESTVGRLLKAMPAEALSTGGPGNMGQPVGTTDGYDAQRKLLFIRLSGPLRNGDGVKFLCSGEPGTQVNGILSGRERVPRAEAGQRIAIPYEGRIPSGCEVRKTLDIELGKQAQRFAEGNLRRVPVTARLEMRVGRPGTLTVTDPEGRTVHAVSEDPVERAEKPRTDDSRLHEQLQKTGDTAYVVTSLEIDAEASVHVPVKLLNSLRRDALLQLDALRGNPYARSVSPAPSLSLPARHAGAGTAGVVVTVNTLEQLAALANLPLQRVDYTDLKTLGAAADKAKGMNLTLSAALPALRGLTTAREMAGDLQTANWQGLLRIANLGQLSLLNPGQKTVGDYPLNVFNPWTAAWLSEQGLESTCLSPELSRDEMLEIAGGASVELLAYGRLVVMTSPLCPVQCGKSCRAGSGQRFSLKDDKGYQFPARCRDGLFEVQNSRVLNLIDAAASLPKGSVSAIRLDFDAETPAMVRRITEGFLDVLSGRAKPRETAAAFSADIHTAGSFRNGIE